jgi:hypothetical protein
MSIPRRCWTVYLKANRQISPYATAFNQGKEN